MKDAWKKYELIPLFNKISVITQTKDQKSSRSPTTIKVMLVQL
jgi:hypothetical protein